MFLLWMRKILEDLLLFGIRNIVKNRGYHIFMAIIQKIQITQRVSDVMLKQFMIPHNLVI